MEKEPTKKNANTLPSLWNNIIYVLVKWEIATDSDPQIDIRIMAWDNYTINKVSE